MKVKIKDNKSHFTTKIPQILRVMLKADAREQGISMCELLNRILANIDIRCAGYHVPTFDKDSPDCYLSANVSKDSWLKFNEVTESRGVYKKILLRNMLRKRYQ